MKITHPFSIIGRGAKVAVALLSTLALLGAGQHAPAASPSELLEKGVYSEETKGDLDAALQLYQQVISEAKGGQELAAQAQYRLFLVSFLKKKTTKQTMALWKQ